MADIIVQGSGELDVAEIAERGISLAGLMEAARLWDCDEDLSVVLEHEPGTDSTAMAYAVLDVCTEWLGGSETMKWASEHITEAALVKMEEAGRVYTTRTRLEAKPDADEC